MKTYADECLERAEKANKWPPIVSSYNAEKEYDHYIPEILTGYESDYKHLADAEFIAHSRTDVPELARRLNRLIKEVKYLNELLVSIDVKDQYDVLNDLVNELEAPLENK